MILRIDHVSLAVKDYKKAKEFFTKIGAIPQTHGRDTNLQYYWEIFKLGDLSRMEIISPTAKESFLKNFFKKKEGGIHHLTLQTPDIEKMREFLEKNKIPYFHQSAYTDAWKEIFIHPKDAFGVLLQIAEFRSNDWLAPSSKIPEGGKWIVKRHNDDYILSFPHPGGGLIDLSMKKEEINKLIQDLKNLVE